MITLYTTFFVPKEKTRLQELLECLRQNISDKRISAIHIVTEEPRYAISDHAECEDAKITWHFVAERPTFQDLLRLAADNEGIVILANTDVYFGRGLENLDTLTHRDALALSRFDKRSNGILVPFHRPDSQDAWILRGPPRHVDCNFPLGIPGCDNRLAHELTQAGYQCVNACNDFEVIHVHASNIRSYIGTGQKVGPPYVQLTPRPKGYWATYIKNVRRTVHELREMGPAAAGGGGANERPTATEEPVRKISKRSMFDMSDSEPHVGEELPHGHARVPHFGDEALGGASGAPDPSSGLSGLSLAPRSPWTLDSVVHAGLPMDSMTKAFRSVSKTYAYVSLEPRKTFNERLMSAVTSQRPILVFLQIQTPDVVRPEILRDVASIARYVVNWTGDVRAPIPKWYYDVAPSVSLTLFSSTTDARTLRRSGLRSDFLQIGFDNDIYVPPSRSTKRSGIVFMGNNYSNRFPLSHFRFELVQALHNKYGKNFILQGGNWGTLAQANTTSNPDQEKKTLQSAAIAVSVSHFQYERYFSDRLLRFMACGPLVLQHWYPGIEIDFTPDKHLVVFHDLDECKQKLDYYLAHPEEAKTIAAAGCAHVHENHTQKIRMLELQALLNGASAL